MTYVAIGLFLATVWAFVIGFFGREFYTYHEEEWPRDATVGAVLIIFIWPFCLVIAIIFGSFALGSRLARK